MGNYDSSQGVWRTIRGRRVFIRDGEDLESAMKRSGKFKTKMNEMAVKGAKKEDLKEQYMTSLNNVSEMEYNGEITKDEYDQSIKNINDEYKSRRKDINGRETKAREIDKINKMSKEDYLKISKDWDEQLQRNPDSEFFKSQRDAWLQKYDEAEAREIDKINQPAGEQTRQLIEEMNVKTFADEIKEQENKGVRALDGSFEKDNKGRIVSEKKYNEFRQAYRDGKISKEDYRNDNYEALNNINPMEEWSDTTGTGLSDTQSTALNKMSLSELRNMANEYDIDTKGKSKKQLLSALISMFNK